MRRATNATVSDIDVVVERPPDRDRLNDQVRSNSATESISGTGGSAVLVTNNSEGNWYLDAVSASALGVTTPGVVVIDVAVRNSNDTVLVEQTFDVTESQIDYGGIQIKPGWDIFYDVSQNDTNSYNVEIEPLIRKPQPGSVTGGGASDDTATLTIDSFEDADISEYTGDTGAFTTQTSDVFHLDTALECSATSGSAIVSSSGLDNYPGQGDTFAYETKATDAGGNNTMRVAGFYNIEDVNNQWATRVNFGDRKLLLLETVSGSTSIVGESNWSSDIVADTWFRARTDYGSDAVSATLYDTSTEETVASVDVPLSDYTRDVGHEGWGWFGRVHTGTESVRMDNARIL